MSRSRLNSHQFFDGHALNKSGNEQHFGKPVLKSNSALNNAGRKSGAGVKPMRLDTFTPNSPFASFELLAKGPNLKSLRELLKKGINHQALASQNKQPLQGRAEPMKIIDLTLPQIRASKVLPPMFETVKDDSLGTTTLEKKESVLFDKKSIQKLFTRYERESSFDYSEDFLKKRSSIESNIMILRWARGDIFTKQSENSSSVILSEYDFKKPIICRSNSDACIALETDNSFQKRMSLNLRSSNESIAFVSHMEIVSKLELDDKPDSPSKDLTTLFDSIKSGNRKNEQSYSMLRVSKIKLDSIPLLTQHRTEKNEDSSHHNVMNTNSLSLIVDVKEDNNVQLKNSAHSKNEPHVGTPIFRSPIETEEDFLLYSYAYPEASHDQSLGESDDPQKKNEDSAKEQMTVEKPLFQNNVSNPSKGTVSNSTLYINQQGRFDSDFSILKLSGSGKSSVSFVCQNRLEKINYNVKITKRKIVLLSEVHACNDAIRIASISRLIGMTHVVHFYNAWYEDRRLHIVEELCRDSLLSIINSGERYSESMIRHVIRDMCLALDQLHSQNIVHLNIKPRNIMFASNFTYKLGGIGFSRLKYMMRNIESREKDGVFMAPELLDSSIPQQSYDFYSLKKADIYSLGMVVYSLITNPNLSIKSSRKYELDIKRVHKINKSPVSNSLRLLVKKMIHYDPSKRPSAKLVLSEFLPSDSEIELRERNCEISTLRKRIDQMELEIHSSNVKKSPSSLRKLSY